MTIAFDWEAMFHAFKDATAADHNVMIATSHNVHSIVFSLLLKDFALFAVSQVLRDGA